MTGMERRQPIFFDAVLDELFSVNPLRKPNEYEQTTYGLYPLASLWEVGLQSLQHLVSFRLVECANLCKIHLDNLSFQRYISDVL